MRWLSAVPAAAPVRYPPTVLVVQPRLLLRSHPILLRTDFKDPQRISPLPKFLEIAG